MINKYIYILLLLSPLFIFNSCDEEDTIKIDEDFVVPSITLYHVNPLTGEDYTEEELASIKHDPRFKEYYQESQEIELAVITDQLPVKTNIRLYEDNSLIGTVDQFNQAGEKYKSDFFKTNASELGLSEDEGTVLVFENIYEDKHGQLTALSVRFEVKIIGNFEVIDLASNTVGHWKFDNPGDLLYATLGNDLILGGDGSHSAVSGPSGSNGATQIDMGSNYEVIHGLPAIGGDRVNEFTLIYDLKIPESSFGTYANLFQHIPENNTDGAVYLRPNGVGFWCKGLSGTGSKSFESEKWYRIVITANVNDLRIYVDGVEAFKDATAPVDGNFSFHLDKFLLFADNGGEDATLHVSEVALVKRSLHELQIASMTGVGAPIY